VPFLPRGRPRAPGPAGVGRAVLLQGGERGRRESVESRAIVLRRPGVARLETRRPPSRFAGLTISGGRPGHGSGSWPGRPGARRVPHTGRRC
jgi:hypothetical protein